MDKYTLEVIVKDICHYVWQDSQELSEEDFKDVLADRLTRFKLLSEVDTED